MQSKIAAMRMMEEQQYSQLHRVDRDEFNYR
jgi:hypothetical protein